MIPRYGEPVKADMRYTPRPGAYAILEREGKFLLTFQEEPEAEFQLPGGGIDPGESPTQALHREVLEETGWRIAITRRLGAFRRFAYMPDYDLWAEKIAHVYLARPVRRHGPPSEPGHHAIWASGVAALDLIPNEGDRVLLARLLGR